MKRRKAEVLLWEALKDLEVGCYNKAVSASYFAVRLMAESFLKGLTTTKDDKIANALGRSLGPKVREEMLWLYEERKKADHRPYLFDKERASLAVKKSSELIELMKRAEL